MPRIIFILLLLSLSLSTEVSAQIKNTSSIISPHRGVDILEVGVRGGVAHHTLAAPLVANAGYGVGLDVVYRGQFVPRRIDVRDPNTILATRFSLGPLVGLGVTYASTSFTMGDSPMVRPSVTNNGYVVVDTFNLAGRENYAKIQLEVPVMFAMTIGGVVFNTGVVGACELWQKQEALLTTPTIKTYIPIARLTVDNPVIPMEEGPSMRVSFHLDFAAQIGYEWQLAERHRLGVQAFVRYDLFPMTSPKNDGVGQWSDGKMTMTYYTGSYKADIHYLDAGLRVYYAFTTPHRVVRLGLHAL